MSRCAKKIPTILNIRKRIQCNWWKSTDLKYNLHETSLILIFIFICILLASFYLNFASYLCRNVTLYAMQTPSTHQYNKSRVYQYENHCSSLFVSFSVALDKNKQTIMYFTSFRGQRLLFRWYTNLDYYNYYKYSGDFF